MLLSHFIRRGYPKKLVMAAMRKAEVLDRDTLIMKNAPFNHIKKAKPIDHESKFFLVNTHNPNNPPLRNIIESNWSLLEKSKTTRFLSNAKLIFGQRRNKKLSDQLVRASTRTLDTTKTNTDLNPCQRPRNCCYCLLINKTGKLTSKTTGKQFSILRNVNCQSSNLIYVITCKHYSTQYVGQTKNRILTRFQGHMFDIAHNSDSTVARHFNQCPKENPSCSKGLIISVVSFIKSHPNRLRLEPAETKKKGDGCTD